MAGVGIGVGPDRCIGSGRDSGDFVDGAGGKIDYDDYIDDAEEDDGNDGDDSDADWDHDNVGAGEHSWDVNDNVGDTDD